MQLQDLCLAPTYSTAEENSTALWDRVLSPEGGWHSYHVETLSIRRGQVGLLVEQT